MPNPPHNPALSNFERTVYELQHGICRRPRSPRMDALISRFEDHSTQPSSVPMSRQSNSSSLPAGTDERFRIPRESVNVASSSTTASPSSTSAIHSTTFGLPTSTVPSILRESPSYAESSCSSSRSSSFRERPYHKPAGPRAMTRTEGKMHRCVAFAKRAGNSIKFLSAVPMPGLNGKCQTQCAPIATPYDRTRADEACSDQEKSAKKSLTTMKVLAAAPLPGLRRYSPTPTFSVKESSDASFRDAISRSEEKPVRKFVNAMKRIFKAMSPTPKQNGASSPCAFEHVSLSPPYRSTWSHDSDGDDDWKNFQGLIILRGEALEARLAEISLERAREREYLMANTAIGMQWKGDWD